MISTLIDFAKALVEIRIKGGEVERERWDRIADYMDKIADALEGAAGAYRDGLAPYREYVLLQRYAVTFEDVARDAFKGAERRDLLMKLVSIIESKLELIDAMDAELYGFKGAPFPTHLWNGKSGYLRDSPDNPPLEESRLDERDPAYGPAPPQPSITELEEAAAGFRAEADIIRAFNPAK